MSREKEQALLVEQIGQSFEEGLKLSPLAARIYALLILSSYEGLTFETIREVIQASKSSTSVNINILSQLEYITFYTKPGDRKRYFKLAKYSALISLEILQQKIEKEMDVIEHINNFNKKYHPEKFTNEKSLGVIFQNYLIAKQKLVDDTIEKMRNFRDNEIE